MLFATAMGSQGQPLHLPTLLFITAILTAFSGTLLVSARRGSAGADAATIWGGSMLMGSIGFAVSAVPQYLSWAGHGLETVFFLGAVAMSWAGAERFADRPVRITPALAGPVVWLLTLPLHDGTGRWTALACGIGGSYTLGVAAAFWASRGEDLPSRRPAIALQLLHAGIYLMRAATALLGVGGERWGATIVVVLVTESLLHTVGMAFLLLAMMKERAELRSNRKLRAMALQDGLTGIGNRRHFDEQLETEVRMARRLGVPLSLLLLDVDHFKAFNDTAGHPEGDVCLRAVAQTLSSVLHRPRDVVARYGGEEFAVLMPNTALGGAMHVGNAIRAGVERLVIANPGIGAVLTISVGAATLSLDGEATGASLVRAADKALYAAKASGRNRVCAAPRAYPVIVAAAD